NETEQTPLLNEEDKQEQSNYLSVPSNQNLYSYDNEISIYNENDILFLVKEKPESRTLRNRIGHMLSTTKWNLTILLMIACDIFIVVLELFVQLDEKKQCDLPDSQPQDSYGQDKFATVVHHLGFVSDIFLYVFTTEVLLHIYCHGYKYLFESWLNFIDSFTVIITFTVTMIITFFSANEKAQGFVDVLIVLRFWRIFCLVESVVNATQLEANLRFKEVIVDLKAEVRILENRKNCYAEKLTELGYDLSKLENDYLFPKDKITIEENKSNEI
ncbi:hypothetical protein BCR36DRAFT_261809, partial [Piromyces finnis]